MRMMKSDPWTREFDGFEKPRGRCRIAAVGTRTRPSQRPLGSSDRWSSHDRIPAVAEPSGRWNIIMGDSRQDSKRKTSYESWTKEQSDVLLELMVD
ncbi:hypothetical protein C2S52_013671, partial [Perilla frutescens var. hirtella]